VPPDPECGTLTPRFLHALLHDLKGPLARVHILAELLVRRVGGQDPGVGGQNSEVQTLVEHIATSAAAVETVLEGVRRYAEALDRAFHPTKFDLTLALRSALARLSVAIADSGANVEFGPLPQVRGDLVQLSVLFQELIANSLRFRSPDPPFIEIASTDCDPAHWVITATDNGSGIQASAMDCIFRPLGKASERAGAGMGLAICRHIADIHGGAITAIPRRQGTEIRLLLPR
jgi:light-regulated signal transduction histidine kinase (bacteriophytochrome)